MTAWPVCGDCQQVAYFPWMGGAHACGHSEDEEPRLQVFLPAPERGYVCGNHFRRHVVQRVVLDGAELAHVVRFFERIQDDDELDEVQVAVRAGGTLECLAAGYVYSAMVGYSEHE